MVRSKNCYLKSGGTDTREVPPAPAAPEIPPPESQTPRHQSCHWRAGHAGCWPAGPCGVRGVMRSVSVALEDSLHLPHPGSSPKGTPLGSPATPHYRAVTSHLRPGSSRASTQFQFARAQFPPHKPPGRACGGKPASPVPLRSTAARPAKPLERSAPRRPCAPCSVRASLHTAPPASRPTTLRRAGRGGASGGRLGESGICGSRPRNRTC